MTGASDTPEEIIARLAKPYVFISLDVFRPNGHRAARISMLSRRARALLSEAQP